MAATHHSRFTQCLAGNSTPPAAGMRDMQPCSAGIHTQQPNFAQHSHVKAAGVPCMNDSPQNTDFTATATSSAVRIAIERRN